MELKNIEKMNKFFTNWLNEHDFDLVAEFSNDFSIDLSSNILYYSCLIPNDLDKIFFEEIQKDFPEFVNCDIFTLSFFHEIGHFETEWMWNDREWKKYHKFIETEKGKIPVNYFRHPVEWEATKWGCEYILDNREEIVNFINGARTVIYEFYEENEIND